MNDDDAAKVNAVWGQARASIAQRNHWLNHPLTRAHIQLRATGDHRKDPLTWWREKFIKQPLENVISIGCGFGEFDRALIRLGCARHVTGLDLSPDAIRAARAAAEQEAMPTAITYIVADLNSYAFKTASYDAIFGISAIHHIAMLEDFFANCRKALKPGGLLFMDEYIGPSRWQMSAAVLDAMNAISAILPERYRMLLELDPVVPRDRIYRIALDWFEQNDPSESVRSDEIMSTLKDHFEVVDYRPYGGAIGHLFFSGIAANFDENNEDHRTIMLLILLIEQLLEKHGVIPSDFAALVARPKP
jgi:2-polyprenyl-3-methyl-5-hydroxy-6-metoxy-1,4-benzoquinol methylase